MTTRSARELLYEGESTLRRLDTTLQELRLHDDASPCASPCASERVTERVSRDTGDLARVVEALAPAYETIRQLLDHIREGRTMPEPPSTERRTGHAAPRTEQERLHDRVTPRDLASPEANRAWLLLTDAEGRLRRLVDALRPFENSGSNLPGHKPDAPEKVASARVGGVTAAPLRLPTR